MEPASRFSDAEYLIDAAGVAEWDALHFVVVWQR